MSFLIDATLSRGGRRVGGTGGDTEAPTVPQNLVATAVSDSQIDLTWDASTDNVGVTGYKIYRDSSFLVEVAGTTYSDTGLQASTQYTYEVSAVDAAGNESAKSTSDSATTNAQASDPVLQPTNADLAVGWTLADDHVTTPDGATDNLTGLNSLFASDRSIWLRPGGTYSVSGMLDISGMEDVLVEGNGSWLRRLNGQDNILLGADPTGQAARWEVSEWHFDGNKANQASGTPFRHNVRFTDSDDVVFVRCNNKEAARSQGDGWNIRSQRSAGAAVAGTECHRVAILYANAWDHTRLGQAITHCHDHSTIGGWYWGMTEEGPAAAFDWEPNPDDPDDMLKGSIIAFSQVMECGGSKNPGGSGDAGEPYGLMAYGWQISRCGPFDGVSPLQPATIQNRSKYTVFSGLQMFDNLATNNGTDGGTRLQSPVFEQGINGGSILLSDWLVSNCKRDDNQPNAIHDYWIRTRRMRHNIDGTLDFFTAMFMDLLFDTRGIGTTEENNCINIQDDLRHLHGLMVIGASGEFSTGIDLSNGASSNVEGLIDGCLVKTGASGVINSPASVDESHNIEAGG